jgi:hypothetical protein
LALFRRKRESEAQPGSDDSRSKRGGVRRQTQEINIDLSALEKGAAAAPAQTPARPRGGQSKRMPAPTTPGPISARKSSRSSGRGTPIGELLIQAAAINTEQLTKALRIQEKQGGSIGQVLVAMGACTPDDIAEALGKQFRFTQVDLKRMVPQPSALILFDGPKCTQHKLIPFERMGRMLCIAMVNVLNRKAITQVESLTQLRVKAFSSVWTDIQAAIEKYYTPEINEASAKVQAERLNDAGKALKLAEQLAEEMSPPELDAPASEAAAPVAQAAPAAAPKPSSEELAQKYISDAGTLRARGRLEDAVKRLEIGAAKLPDAKTIQKALAQLQREMAAKRAEEAARHAKVAELLAAGRAAREAGDPDAAFASFQEAAQLDPQNTVVAREIAAVQKDMARVKAEQAAQRKLEQEAKLVEEKRKGEAEARKQVQIAELLALAKAARSAGRLEEAESRLQDVLALDESHAVAAKQLSEVQQSIRSQERQLKDTIRTALQTAEKLTEAARFDEARATLQEAIGTVGEDPGLVAAMHDIDAAARQKDKLDEAAKRRRDQEKQELQGDVRSLMDQAAGAESSGDLEQAEQLLEDALALDPDNVEAIARVGSVREAIRSKLEEEETRRRAKEELRKHEDEVVERMREISQDREAGRLELAQHKLLELNKTDPGRAEVRQALDALEKDLDARRHDEEERLRKEEEERRRIEDSLRLRAAAAAEASADRIRTEAAVGGEQRLDAGSVSEENLIAIDLTPEAQLPSVADAVSRRTGGGVASTTEALRRLPVAQMYAKSIDDLRKLAAAAQAIDAVMEEEVAVPVGEEELELELEPTLDAQPPMPDLEAQLEAEPEAILEALPVDDETDAEDVLEAEMAEVVEERLTAKPMSDAEFEGLRSQLEPDPAQEWWDCFASAGPVPAVPIED